MYRQRLTVIGRKQPRLRFQDTDWLPAFTGRHAELVELWPRYVCYFEADTDPLPSLERLSRSHPGLVFLLAYETTRCHGLAKAQAGRLTQHRVRY